MPDLQNLGWSTKLRKLFTESHCVNCYVSSLWKVASYSTMAPSFLVGSKDQCLGILEILPIAIIDGRLFEKFEETHLSSDGGAIPHFYRKEREKEGHCQISDFSGSLKGRWLTTHPGSFAAGLRLGWLYQLMWCRIQTCAVVGGMWRCRSGHLKWRRTASGCSQRWHHREVTGDFVYLLDSSIMLTLEKSKPFSPHKSIFSTILAKVCFTN